MMLASQITSSVAGKNLAASPFTRHAIRCRATTIQCWERNKSSVSSLAFDLGEQTEKHQLYPNLFSSLDLGPAGILPNRVLMGSMHTGLEGHSIPGWMERWMMRGEDCHDEHSLERMAKYFKARAEGGVGLMVTGGCSRIFWGIQMS